MNTRKTILVGVDGSENSVLALKWALREAKMRGDSVEVLHGWHFPYVADPTGLAPYPAETLLESAEAVLHDVLTACAAESEGVPLKARVVQSAGAEFLVKASADADLLVVGRRGHGGFLTLVMGSVAQQVAAHAHCPVVIVGPN
ncbi:MAG TPA: universal stress protein [Ilumatobacteraceae bacterium]|nr:universal stress protein [Ilumatobacteraceae bacterium]